MKKLFCDLCEEEITNGDFVNQSIFCNFDFNESIDVDICKQCWETERKKIEKNPLNKKETIEDERKN